MCEAVKDAQAPQQDLPAAEDKQSLANCVSQDLYFGFGRAADPVLARKCAYLEIERGKDDLDIAARAILSMVYANGKGADRNLDLALKFACQMPGAPGDVAGNIYELQRLKSAPPSARYHVCDHSAGPHLYKSCAILFDRFDQLERASKISALTAQWGPREQKAFASLQDAANKFFASRTGGEIDLRPTFEVQERAFLENGFISKLEQLQKGELPNHSAADFRAAQQELDAEYAGTQKDPNRKWGTASAEGVRRTQQLWLSYRDSWVKFGKIKYPRVSPDSWKTWITEERVSMLKVLLQ